MKRICRKISILAVFLLLSGCKKELDIELENLVIEPEIVQYIGTEDADNIAVDEQGILYTSNFILAENSSTGTNQQEFSVPLLDWLNLIVRSLLFCIRNIIKRVLT